LGAKLVWKKERTESVNYDNLKLLLSSKQSCRGSSIWRLDGFIIIDRLCFDKSSFL